MSIAEKSRLILQLILPLKKNEKTNGKKRERALIRVTANEATNLVGGYIRPQIESDLMKDRRRVETLTLRASPDVVIIFSYDFVSLGCLYLYFEEFQHTRNLSLNKENKCMIFIQ